MFLACTPEIPLPALFSQAAKHAPAAQASNRAASATQKTPKTAPQKKPDPPQEKAATGATTSLSKAAASSAPSSKLKPALNAQDSNTPVAAASLPSATNVSSSQPAKGSPQAAASGGASGTGSAPGPSQKPAGDQSQTRGLAKGFFSKSSGLGVKSASPASSAHQAKPAALETSKAERSPEGRLLQVPESWFSRNREIDNVIAASLRELEQRLTIFLDNFKHRSQNLQLLLGHWDFLDHAVRHHLEQLKGMCGDLENNVYDFVTLEDDPEVDGPYAVSRTQELQQNVRGIYVPQSYDCSIAGVEDMLRMYQVSLQHLLKF